MADVSKKDLIFCEKCHRTLKRSEFYKSNNLEKYPNGGTIPICKKCATMHVNNWDPSTFLWILQEADVPYIPKEWDQLLMSYGTDKSKVTGLTIIGRYIGKMHLNQYKKYRWRDSEALRLKDEKELTEAMERQGKSQTEIDEVLEANRFIIPEGELKEPEIAVAPMPADNGPESFISMPVGGNFEETAISAEELGLTEDDVRYLKLRWGRAYKPEEWIYLERFYRNFEETYDIHTAGHKDTLMKLAKVSLKLDQLIDLGDIEGAQKAEKMYDSLMKSGSFTAHQNKEEEKRGIDSLGEVVALCESKGFIPRYYVDSPKDKVDRVLQDLQEYTRSLIMEETNIGDLIDNAVRQIELDKQKEAEADLDGQTEEEALEESLFSENKRYLSDNAFTEFGEFEEELEAENEKLFSEGE